MKLDLKLHLSQYLNNPESSKAEWNVLVKEGLERQLHKDICESISIYKTTNTNIRIGGLSQGKSNVKLYNILGKQVLNTSFNTTGIQDITLPKLVSGVYILQLETETGILNKKITIE